MQRTKHEVVEDKGRSAGKEARELYQEMQSVIQQLDAMRKYAHNNNFDETEKNLDEVIKSFEKLKKRYGSADVLNDIKISATSSRLFQPMRMNQQISEAKSILMKAKKDMGIADKNEIISSLMKSHLQLVYEDFKDFFAPLNKFESFLIKIENFEKKKIKEKAAKNAPQFAEKQSAPQKK